MLWSNILYNDANLTEMHNLLYTVAFLYTAVVIYFLLPLCGLSSVNRTIFFYLKSMFNFHLYIYLLSTVSRSLSPNNLLYGD